MYPGIHPDKTNITSYGTRVHQNILNTPLKYSLNYNSRIEGLSLVSRGAEQELGEDEGDAAPDVGLVICKTVGVDERLQATRTEEKVGNKRNTESTHQSRSGR